MFEVFQDEGDEGEVCEDEGGGEEGGKRVATGEVEEVLCFATQLHFGSPECAL